MTANFSRLPAILSLSLLCCAGLDILTWAADEPVAGIADPKKPKTPSILEAVQPVVDQSPELKELLSQMDVDETGQSSHLDQPTYDRKTKTFQDKHMGPYSLYIKPKQSGLWATAVVRIETDIKYFNRKGPTDEAHATSFTETLRNFSTQKLLPPDPRIFGSWKATQLQDELHVPYKSFEITFFPNLTGHWHTVLTETAALGPHNEENEDMFYEVRDPNPDVWYIGQRETNEWQPFNITFIDYNKLRVAVPASDEKNPGFEMVLERVSN